MRHVRGARAVAGQAVTFAPHAESIQPVLVNAAAGVVSWLADGQPFSVMGFTVKSGKIVEIDAFQIPRCWVDSWRLT
jgi:hypothetical protein